MTDPTPTRDDAVPSDLIKFAKVGLHSLEMEWLKIINNRPGLSDEGFARLKKETVVVRLLADIEAARLAIEAASAPAPASGRVDAVAYCWVRETGGTFDSESGGEPSSVEFLNEPARGAFPLYRQPTAAVEACAQISERWSSALLPGSAERLAGHNEARSAIAEAIRSALSPAATPVSEAGGELTDQQIKDVWKASMLSETGGEFIPAFRAVIAADRELRALAKPASSPAGGDVREAHALKTLMKAIQRAEDGAGTLPAKEAVKLRPADWHAVCDRARKLAALSQSTSAGRVGA